MFKYEVRVYFFNADPAGILFYGELFKLSHSTYEEFLLSNISDKNYFFDKGIVLPIIETKARYFKPIIPHNIITIHLNVENLKPNSFELNYKFYSDKNELMAECSTVHVAVSRENFKKTNLPEDLAALLREHLIINFQQ